MDIVEYIYQNHKHLRCSLAKNQRTKDNDIIKEIQILALAFSIALPFSHSLLLHFLAKRRGTHTHIYTRESRCARHKDANYSLI